MKPDSAAEELELDRATGALPELASLHVSQLPCTEFVRDGEHIAALIELDVLGGDGDGRFASTGAHDHLDSLGYSRIPEQIDVPEVG
ncbi:hypothetical protein NQK81_01235 [Amycolatopsis roodepoortensis]|uniref:hypothetical protein n=1 Tax=Amycolatopsis roodepoortensis TaxID=700274 RepID=UPI00214C80C3|nr:hypothetical protein [Amycolatopsis roodepoortensis]UUV32098.1 hypothetical protein NQK81_01235 [Amycolatopsis roodepoortensis]